MQQNNTGRQVKRDLSECGQKFFFFIPITGQARARPDQRRSGKRPGETPVASRPIEPFNDFSSHNEWGTDHFGFMYDGDLEAFCADLAVKGVAFPVPLKQGVNGKWLCYISAPDNVSIELMQV